MNQTYKPHYILVLISTIKSFGVIALFALLSAVVLPKFIAPNQPLTSIYHLLKLLLWISVAVYIYLMFFWRGITVSFDEEHLDFKMTMGRKNHIQIAYSDIETIKIKQGFLEKLFRVSKISLTLKNRAKTYGDETMVLEQYLVFNDNIVNNIVTFIESRR